MAPQVINDALWRQFGQPGDADGQPVPPPNGNGVDVGHIVALGAVARRTAAASRRPGPNVLPGREEQPKHRHARRTATSVELVRLDLNV
jgi:hypothetical protein